MSQSHAAGWSSDAPTAAQLKEFFAQVESGRITKIRLQTLLGAVPRRLIEEWVSFYQRHFPGMGLDLSGLVIPDDPGGFGKVLILSRGLSLAHVYGACKKVFSIWGLDDYDYLDKSFSTNTRNPKYDGTYAVRVIKRPEAERGFSDFEVDELEESGVRGETLLERLIHELKYFDETGDNLDKQHVTICSGTRRSDPRGGGVPGVCWRDGHVLVNTYTLRRPLGFPFGVREVVTI